MSRALLATCALLLLTGCGHERTTSGHATLWVTRDRGATVLAVRTVPAGLTAMQALDRDLDVKTRYGGRFVQSIQGLQGELSKRRDWFWFLNGIEADRSASDYRLRDGDVEWWDYRSWQRQMRVPVVVGAFPEPFVHGYDGEVRPVAVRYAAGGRGGGKAIGRLLHAGSVGPLATPVPPDANVFVVEQGPSRFTAAMRGDDKAGAPVVFVFAGDAARLARRPRMFRFRYAVP